MSNGYFSFKQFTVRQERCAMKVGTDGTLLGAWARVPAADPSSDIPAPRILDIGTGTGLIALMMAQRFPHALITGIDTDAGAVVQARENAEASPFAPRIRIVHRALQDMPCGSPPSGGVLHPESDGDTSVCGGFRAIVCNPPFFTGSLECPDEKRTMARHASSLSYEELMSVSFRLLDVGGELSVVTPYDSLGRMDSAAAIAGFCTRRVCTVRTTARKPPKRVLLAYGRERGGDVETSEIVIGSDEYNDMMSDFYLKTPGCHP